MSKPRETFGIHIRIAHAGLLSSVKIPENEIGDQIRENFEDGKEVCIPTLVLNYIVIAAL